MATVRNISIDQGTDFTMTINLSDASDVPVNLTGHTFLAEIRRSYYSTTAIPFTVTSGTPASGIMTLDMAAALTQTLKTGRYVFDVLIIDSQGKPSRVLEGIVTVNPQVTKITTTTTAAP